MTRRCVQNAVGPSLWFPFRPTGVPERPEIDGLTKPAKEGDYITLTCMTQGSKPAADLRWFRNEKEVKGTSRPFETHLYDYSVVRHTAGLQNQNVYLHLFSNTLNKHSTRVTGNAAQGLLHKSGTINCRWCFNCGFGFNKQVVCSSRFRACPLAWDWCINLSCYEKAVLNHSDWTVRLVSTRLPLGSAWWIGRFVIIWIGELRENSEEKRTGGGGGY